MKAKLYEAASVDVLVVGAGHAGIEASLAAARMGKKYNNNDNKSGFDWRFTL